jgi:glycosyltransferase involved in cell wall biosynthesis
VAAALVTVVVPTYNSGRFLKPAVQSALSAGADEVLVVDDGSTDGSVEDLAFPGVRVLRQPNRGEAAARNTGLRQARGRYITMLDGDDLLSGEGLKARLDYLEENVARGAVGGLPENLVGTDGAVLGEVRSRMAAKLNFPFELTLDYYRKGGFFPVSCSLYVYRREALERVGPYDETLKAAPDADFHFRYLSVSSMPILNVGTFERRLHSSNLSMAAAVEGAPEFRKDILEAIRTVNSRFGLSPSEITPWETEYL